MTTIQEKSPSPALDARRRRMDKIYAIPSGDDRTERACADIPRAECTNLPRNYVLYVKHLLPGQPGTLGIIVIAAGLATALSSPFWGCFADLSSRKVLMMSGVMAATTGGGALAMGLLPSAYRNPILAGVIFILLGFAEAGALLGRKTYLIDRTTIDQRATFVAFANTASVWWLCCSVCWGSWRRSWAHRC